MCIIVYMHNRHPIARREVLGPLTALADDSRLRLLELLAAHGECRAQELVELLGVSQPNLSRHIKQLVAAGLVGERRAGDASKRYSLRPEAVRALSDKLETLISPDNARASLARDAAAAEREIKFAALPLELRASLDEDLRVTHFSTKRSEQKLVLAYLFEKFETGRTYSEKEVNQVIHRWLAPELMEPRLRGASLRQSNLYGIDAVTLRRALVEECGLERTSDGSSYWRAAASPTP